MAGEAGRRGFPAPREKAGRRSFLMVFFPGFRMIDQHTRPAARAIRSEEHE